MTNDNYKPQWYDDPEQLALCRRVHCKGVSDDEWNTFLSICKRTGLDPFARQIYCSIRKSQRGGVWTQKMDIAATIDGFRVVAERTGKYEGQTPAHWCGPDGKWQDAWLSPEPPSACKVGVWKRGFREALVAVALFEEYAQYVKGEQGAGQKLGHMWAKMPSLMVQKCAEALALRKAFPQDLSGLYTSDEMAQASNPVKEHRPEDEDQRPPDDFDRSKLPKTSPLAPGTFEQAKTVSDPSPANKIAPEASQSPSPATPATEPTITNWKDLPYTNGKGKTKKLGAMSETFLNDLHGYFESTKPSTKEHQLVKAGLAIRHGELHSNPVDKLFEWAKENKVDPAALLAVAQRGLNSEAKDFFDMEQDAAQSLLDDPEKTLKAVQFELDDLPK